MTKYKRRVSDRKLENLRYEYADQELSIGGLISSLAEDLVQERLKSKYFRAVIKYVKGYCDDHPFHDDGLWKNIMESIEGVLSDSE